LSKATLHAPFQDGFGLPDFAPLRCASCETCASENPHHIQYVMPRSTVEFMLKGGAEFSARVTADRLSGKPELSERDRSAARLV
jgi:hypothetical protein